MDNGGPTKMLEFPIDDPLVPARDEAWRLQMAIDANRSTAQRYATHPADTDGVVVRFFSPDPSFAAAISGVGGGASPEEPRCLFAFRVPDRGDA